MITSTTTTSSDSSAKSDAKLSAAHSAFAYLAEGIAQSEQISYFRNREKNKYFILENSWPFVFVTMKLIIFTFLVRGRSLTI